MTQKWEEPFWYSGVCNFLPEAREGMTFPERVEIYDLTLDEDGEGMAGAYMTEEEKLSVATLLDEIGIHRIGVLGFPSPISKEDVAAARKITHMGLKAKFQTLATSREDVDSAIEAGVWGVILRCPISDLYAPDVDPVEKRIKNFVQLAGFARSKGLHIGMMAQDITRATLETVKGILTSIHRQVGLDELCVTDSQGMANPFAFNFLIKKIRSWINVPLAVHCHNHLGLGVANACAAVAAGAQIVHTTVNGLGHFAGMPPLEEVAAALRIGFGIDLGIKYERLYELSKTVEKFTGVKMQPHKAVVGDMMFSRSEERKDVQELLDRRKRGLLKGFFPYLPEFVGNRSRVVMAEKTTRLAVEFNLAEMGIKATDQQIDEIHRRVKNTAMRERRIVSEEEFMKISEEVKRF
jgi:isopropylmalate/homocitrate/citramalate synthase